MDIHMIPCTSTCCGPQHCLWWYRPQTSTWPPGQHGSRTPAWPLAAERQHNHSLLSHPSLLSSLWFCSLHIQARLCPSIFPTSPWRILSSRWHWKMQCATQDIFLSSSFTCKYTPPRVGLVQGFWFLMHHKHGTIARTCLRNPALAQHQGDLEARQAT